MCGMIGYSGPKRRSLSQELVRHLKVLEYRGYDSAGVVASSPTGLHLTRCVGEIARLQDRLRPAKTPAAAAGFAHTRWATHGAVTEANAHPLVSASGELTLALNGVVENDDDLRQRLTRRDVEVASDCDAATLLEMISVDLAAHGGDLASAVGATLAVATGRLAFCVIDRRRPDCLVVARRGSPLFVGRAGKSAWVASDPAALPETVTELWSLRDGATLTIVGGQVAAEAQRVLQKMPLPKHTTASAKTGSNAQGSHYERELREQPQSIAYAVTAAMAAGAGDAVQARQLQRVLLVGCGSAYHACLAAKSTFERYARLPAEAVAASEVQTDAGIDGETLVVAVSQSGETADTLLAVQRLSAKGAVIVSLTNTTTNSLAQQAAVALALDVGPELSVASTKAYTAMLARLSLLAAELGVRRQSLAAPDFRALLDAGRQLGDAVAAAITCKDSVQTAVNRWRDREGFLFIGRGSDHATALEGALKLRELSYRHTYGVAAGELKHGSIALVEAGYPVVAICTDAAARVKMTTAVREVRTRGADVLAVVTRGFDEVAAAAQQVIELPPVTPALAAVVATVPLQWLALLMAEAHALNVDRPRNLAKSVTVV